MIVINESSIIVRDFLRHTKPMGIEFVSTLGFLNSYNLPQKNKYDSKDVLVIPRNPDVSSLIANIRNKKVIIATDIDGAGHLIALEVVALLEKKTNDIYRYTQPFENMFMDGVKIKTPTQKDILANSVKGVDVESALAYLKSRSDWGMEERVEVVRYLKHNKIDGVDLINGTLLKNNKEVK